MIHYIGKRLLQMIPILIIVAILIFSLMSLVPGDPVQIMLGDNATAEQIALAKANWGLDKPFMVRLGEYLVDLVHLDFGNSYTQGTAVGTELMARFPKTLTLATFSILFTVLIGVPIGIQCAINANKLSDKVWMFLTMLGNSIPNFARMMRANILTVRNSEFIEAATSINCSTFRIILRHVIPNAISPLIVQVAMGIASAALSASGLSFLGFGVQQPTPEWGAMLASARGYMRDYPHMVIIPGLFIMLTVLSFNLLGDAVRDALDPKLRD